MIQSLRDSCLFIYRKDSRLEGLILLHVDDFLAGGSDIFERDIVKMMLSKFCFGEISNNKFTYTGITIKQNKKKRNNFNESKPIH